MQIWEIYLLINKQRKSIKNCVLFLLTGKSLLFLTQGYFNFGDFELRKDFVNFFLGHWGYLILCFNYKKKKSIALSRASVRKQLLSKYITL